MAVPQKVSEKPAAVDINLADIIYLIQAGVSKKTSIGLITQFLATIFVQRDEDDSHSFTAVADSSFPITGSIPIKYVRECGFTQINNKTYPIVRTANDYFSVRNRTGIVIGNYAANEEVEVYTKGLVYVPDYSIPKDSDNILYVTSSGVVTGIKPTTGGVVIGSILSRSVYGSWVYINILEGSYPVVSNTKGLSTWNSTTIYNTTDNKFAEYTIIERGATSANDGVSKLFKSIQNNNVNHLPTDTAWWIEVSPTEIEELTTIPDKSVSSPKLADEFSKIVTQTSGVINWATGVQFNLTLTTSLTVTFSNLAVGKTISLLVSGNYAITWPSYCVVKGAYNGAKKNLIQMYCASNTAGSEYVAVSIFN